MFKFNFPNPATENNAEECGHSAARKESDDCDKTECSSIQHTEELPAEEVIIDGNITASKKFDNFTKHTFVSKDITSLVYLDCQEVEKYLSKHLSKHLPKHLSNATPHLSAISQAVSSHSDLVPGVYEGGLKVWESSLDLVDHLSGLQIALRGLTVLELGCGAGLPGLYALAHRAHVTFQDYNREVITGYTIPNCVLTTSSDQVRDRCRFYCGDWGTLGNLLQDRQNSFDLILTSETIYQPSNYHKLHHLFNTLLTPSGTIYVAAKVYYFGVGGGVSDFVSFVRNQAMFSVESTITQQTGVQREVLCLRRKS